MVTIAVIIEGSAIAQQPMLIRFLSKGSPPLTNIYIRRRKPNVELEKMKGAELTKTEGARKKWKLISLQLL